MSNLYLYPFQPIKNSTAPSFSASGATAAALFAIETSALREWQFPTSRALRFAELTGGDYYVKFGTSDAVAASTDTMLILGGTVEVHRVEPGISHISIWSSTNVTVNVTLGHGS